MWGQGADDVQAGGCRLSGVPVIGKQGAFVIVIEPDDLKPVDLIPVDPWAPDGADSG